MSLSRHQLLKKTREANPDIEYMSPLFRECFLLNASIQQNTINPAALASFTGMSKGEVRRHLISIGNKLQAAEKHEKEIREYEPTNETAEAATTEREGLDHRGTDTQEAQPADRYFGDVPPVGT